MGIYDTMNQVRCDVATICFGFTASMGAFRYPWKQGQTHVTTKFLHHDSIVAAARRDKRWTLRLYSRKFFLP
jgi:hypothetical protein